VKILDRYVFRETGSYFVIALLAFTVILLVMRMLRLASLVINRGVEFGQLGMVLLSILPTFLEIALPLACLLGVMLGVGRLCADSEVVVMRSCGVGIKRLQRPVVALGLLASALAICVSFYLSPLGFQKLSSTLFEIAKSRTTAGLEPGVFNRLGPITLYAEGIDYHNGELRNVLIDDKRGTRKVLNSASGSIKSNADAREIQIVLKDGFIHEQVADKYLLTYYTQNGLTLNADELFAGNDQKVRALRELTLNDIRSEMLSLKSEVKSAPAPLTKEFVTKKERIARLRTESARRFAMPFAPLFLALLALPLAIQTPRTQKFWGPGISFALGIGVFVIYYATFSIGFTLSESGVINPYWGLWLPNLATCGLGLYLMSKIGSEQWPSVSSLFENLFERAQLLWRRAPQS